MKKILCDQKTERVSVHVVAKLVAGKLSISGQDVGPAVEEYFGDSDYEYFYSFSEANTRKLLESLKPGADLSELLDLLADKFSGLDGCSLLREHCEEEQIEYQFDSF